MYYRNFCGRSVPTIFFISNPARCPHDHLTTVCRLLYSSSRSWYYISKIHNEARALTHGCFAKEIRAYRQHGIYETGSRQHCIGYLWLKEAQCSRRWRTSDIQRNSRSYGI